MAKHPPPGRPIRGGDRPARATCRRAVRRLSRTTAEAADRDDVVDPDEPVLDDVDRIIGCRALALVR